MLGKIMEDDLSETPISLCYNRIIDLSDLMG